QRQRQRTWRLQRPRRPRQPLVTIPAPTPTTEEQRRAGVIAGLLYAQATRARRGRVRTPAECGARVARPALAAHVSGYRSVAMKARHPRAENDRTSFCWVTLVWYSG